MIEPIFYRRQLQKLLAISIGCGRKQGFKSDGHDEDWPAFEDDFLPAAFSAHYIRSVFGLLFEQRVGKHSISLRQAKILMALCHTVFQRNRDSIQVVPRPRLATEL